MDWAKHRRRKAAAKMHLRLDLHSFLPSFAVVDTAGQHDNKRAREVYATIQAGEIVVFDKAYVDFDHLSDLDARDVSWVTRAKDNMQYRVVKNLTKGHKNIMKDQIIALQGKHKGVKLRRVEARVEVDDAWRTCRIGAQLYAVVCCYALGTVGADRLIGIAEILWDSIRAVQGDRSTQYRMVTGVCAGKNVNSWDSIGSQSQ